MKSGEDFKYDVAFSFCAGDEGLAAQLNDLLEGRFETFLYSERQAEIAGTDGESSFNDVFAKDARCVVVLYRQAWGQSSWTRIEETAIRNRAHSEGYDFALFIPLDAQPSVPKWLPKNRLWIGLDRWGSKGAAAVIEARAQELGAAPHIETLADRAARHARTATFASDMAAALGDYVGVAAFNAGALGVVDALRVGVQTLNNAQSATQFRFLRYNAEPFSATYILGLENGLSLHIKREFANSLNNACLETIIWLGVPDLPGRIAYERASQMRAMRFELGYSAARTYVWLPTADKSLELSDAEAAEYIIRWYLDNG